MLENKIDKNALTEVYIILMELNLFSKLPEEFQLFIVGNKNNDYMFTFDKKIPLFNQLENDTTRVLLSYIYIKYINNSASREVFLLNEVMDIIAKQKD